MIRPLVLAALAVLADTARAEMMSVTESASYAMSDEESRNAGRQHCVEAAKHTALDRAGSVFEAELKSDSAEAGKDEAQLKMRSYFAGVVSSQLVGEHIDVDGAGRATETCEVKITYDPESVSAKMHEIADAEGLRRQVAEQQTTIAALQDQVVRQAPPQTAPPAGFTAPPQVAAYAPPAAATPVPKAAPRVYYTPPVSYVPPAPAPVYYAPPRVYYPPPQPVVYYAPPPPPPVVVWRARPRRLTLVRLAWWQR